jgi:transposase-like protein
MLGGQEHTLTDAAAAKRFFRKALAQQHTVNPRTITVEKNPSYPKAVAEMKNDAELWRRSRLRHVKNTFQNPCTTRNR